MGPGRRGTLPQEGVPLLSDTKVPYGPLATRLELTQKFSEQQWLSMEATSSFPLSACLSFPMTPEARCAKSHSTAIHGVAQALTNDESKSFQVACTNIPI